MTDTYTNPASDSEDKPDLNITSDTTIPDIIAAYDDGSRQLGVDFLKGFTRDADDLVLCVRHATGDDDAAVEEAERLKEEIEDHVDGLFDSIEAALTLYEMSVVRAIINGVELKDAETLRAEEEAADV